MFFTLVVPLPQEYESAIEAFQRTFAEWAVRPTSMAPHVTVKVAGGLDDSPAMTAIIERIAMQTTPFAVRLSGVAVFGGERPALYIGVDSPGLRTLHHEIVHAVVARAGMQAGEFELGGYTPHATLMYPKPKVLAQSEALVAKAEERLSPYPTFTAASMTMHRLDGENGYWVPVRDFAIG